VQESKGEWGPGQEELTLNYAEALAMADRHVFYKNGVKEIAYLQGKAVTFMAKWRADLAGSSCHIHTSLWDDTGKPAFGGHDGESTLFRQFLAGMLAVGPEITFLLAPTVNSYKRFQAGSFAPTNMVWSRDNRTAGFRVLGHGPSTRIECRVPGADVNPYLAYAGLLAAGLHGRRAAPRVPPRLLGRRLRLPRGHLRAPDPARGRGPARPLRRAARRPQRRGDRPLRPRRAAGSSVLRQGGHGLGTGAVLRAG
jgi:glutamine synthetase